MLKLFRRTLFIAILSSSFLINGFVDARAESVSTKGVGDEDMLSSLTMSAVGILASRLVKCKMTTDMMLAAAGGAAYFAGEVIAYSDLKKVIEDMETDLKRDENGHADRMQLIALEKLKKSYEKAKKAAGTKKSMQQLAAAAFAAAGIAAYMQAAEEEAAITACQTAIGTAQGAASTACAAEDAGCCAAIGMLSATVPAPRALDKMTLIPAPSATQATKTSAQQATLKTELSSISSSCLAAAGVQACSVIDTTYLTTKGVCPVALTVDNILGIEPNTSRYANTFSNFFMSEARADMFSPMGIASGVAINYIIGTATSIGAMIDIIMFSPMNRAKVWAVLAALTYKASDATDNVIKKLEENIAKIDAILNEMYKLNNGNAGVNTAVAGKSNGNNKTTIAGVQANGDVIYSSSEAQQDLPCVTGPDSKKCASFMEKLQSSPGFSNFTPDMKNMVLQIARGVNHVNGVSSLTTGDLAAINAAIGNASALNTMLAKKQKELQAILKKNGSKVNLAHESEKFEKSLSAIMEKGLKEKKMSAREMAALIGTGALQGQLASKNSTFKAISTDLAKKASQPTHVGALAGNHLPSPAATGVEGITMKDGLETAPENINAGNSNDKYEISNLDIATNKNESIFQLLSNRYLKSAFPRLLDKAKEKK